MVWPIDNHGQNHNHFARMLIDRSIFGNQRRQRKKFIDIFMTEQKEFEMKIQKASKSNWIIELQVENKKKEKRVHAYRSKNNKKLSANNAQIQLGDDWALSIRYWALSEWLMWLFYKKKCTHCTMYNVHKQGKPSEPFNKKLNSHFKIQVCSNWLIPIVFGGYSLDQLGNLSLN